MHYPVISHNRKENEKENIYVLQLRPVHRLPGAHAAGPALPDAQLAARDLLGLLLAAVLPPAGQRPRGRLQEDVSASPRPFPSP